MQSSPIRDCREPPRDRTLPFSEVPLPPDPSTATTFPAPTHVGPRCIFLAIASAGLAAGSASEKAPDKGWRSRVSALPPRGSDVLDRSGRSFLHPFSTSFEADLGRPDDSISTESDPPPWIFIPRVGCSSLNNFSQCLTMMEWRSLPLCARACSAVRLTLRNNSFHSLRNCF